VFGDLFLEDVRNYRDAFLARHSFRGLYPVWLRDTSSFVNEFIALGFKAIVTCTNAKVLGPAFAGRLIDEAFLSELPHEVDPCGENGEFHTFVYDGPNFKQPVAFSKGEVVERDGFCFCDLLAE
jgi:diphthamide synthase (EF-2-diphthine--ammonia ligase)